MAPSVTVLMPVHNAERHVSEAIESVLAQTFEDFEFLILDDGSRDGSREVVRSYAQHDSRIRYVERVHAGFAQTLNAGLEQARGRYVARMDADDRCRPERLARQVRYLEAHPAAAAVGCDALKIDPEGMPVGIRRHPRDHDAVQASMLGGGFAFTHPAITMRRRAARRTGGYDASYRPVEDLDFMLKLSEQGRFANLPTVLLEYRLRHQSMSRGERAPLAERARRAISEARARRGLPGRLPPSAYARVAPEPPIFFHLQWAWQALRNGFWATARKHLQEAFQLDPFLLLKPSLLARVVPPRNLFQFLKRHLFPQ